jgi:hypothetical protein
VDDPSPVRGVWCGLGRCGIDVLVDDSSGVALEGEKHGFRVITIAPFEDHWVDIVRDALRRDIRG